MANDRCVLWVARGRDPDAELMGALSRGGLTVEPCSNPYEALARLCLASRRKPDPAKTRAVILLAADPDTLESLGEVTQIADRCARGSAVWVFDSPTRRLHAATPTDLARWQGVEVRTGSALRSAAGSGGAAQRVAPAPTPAAARPVPSPALRLAGQGSLPPAPKEEAAATPDKSRSDTPAEADPRPAGLLSDEELEMLLSPHDPPAQN